MHCVVCSAIAGGQHGLENIDFISPFSKKSVSSIITYLGKKASPSIDITWAEESCEWKICKPCLEDVITFDECMVKLLEVQKRIVSLLRRAAIKEESIEFEPVVDVLPKNILSNSKHIDSGDDEGNDLSVLESDMKAESSFEDNEFCEDSEDFGSDNEESEKINKESNRSSQKYTIPKKCNMCTKVFKNDSLLQEHIELKHNPSKKIWKCEICGARARSEEYLELHMNVHEGKSVLECKYCNKRYKRKINVIIHMQKHWDKKNIQCERCGLTFSEQPAYYNHKLLHEAEDDPLICATCHQIFKTRRTYRSHLWTHREDRPRFSCEVCGKTFVEKYTLKVHSKCHIGNESDNREYRQKSISAIEEPKPKSFECIICGDKYQSNDLLDQHMKVQHDVVL
ncbi:serendipity locus protein delta-like [Eurosta solidaginis]|uniref:serendipity locus protein delta-like n=1 Tax=Eurosta solidaginis TaxID=178769 RepID=UPI0035312895